MTVFLLWYLRMADAMPSLRRRLPMHFVVDRQKQEFQELARREIWLQSHHQGRSARWTDEHFDGREYHPVATIFEGEYSLEFLWAFHHLPISKRRVASVVQKCWRKLRVCPLTCESTSSSIRAWKEWHHARLRHLRTLSNSKTNFSVKNHFFFFFSNIIQLTSGNGSGVYLAWMPPTSLRFGWLARTAPSEKCELIKTNETFFLTSSNLG